MKLLLLAILFVGCQTTKQPGVIAYTKNARIVAGNAKHFQMKHDAKVKREQDKIVVLNGF